MSCQVMPCHAFASAPPKKPGPLPPFFVDMLIRDGTNQKTQGQNQMPDARNQTPVFLKENRPLPFPCQNLEGPFPFSVSFGCFFPVPGSPFQMPYRNRL